MTTAILYSGTRNASSWAMRAWLALRAAEFPFEEVVVDIRRPQRYVNLERLGRISPSATVPALVVDGTIVFDSLAIMEFANEHAQGRLLPTDPHARAVARSLVAWQHAGLSRICARISFESSFYPWKRPLSSEEQGDVRRLAAVLEPPLCDSGGPYLFGDITLADCALAPAAIRLLRHRPDLTAWPATAAWMQAMVETPMVAEWLADADALPHIWYDEYLLDAPASTALHNWRDDRRAVGGPADAPSMLTIVRGDSTGMHIG